MVLVKFGMRNRPSMLVISDGCGHASSSRTDLLPFESNRGSKANVLSAMNKSAGRLTSTYSPGHTVVLVDGARSTWARRIACRLRAVSVVPYVYVVPSANLMIRLAGRIATSLISVKGFPASSSTSRFCKTKPVNANLLFLRVRHMDVSPIMVSGDEPSAW